ncbi:MAG: transcriptional regulator GcvA [Sphingomonadales bacterium]
MKRALLPLNALRVFDAAARHLSFKLAADELAVTPAAVSQQIRSLEDYLGVVLFKRQARSLSLTEEGLQSLPALRAGFERFEEAVKILQAGQASDILTVSVSPSFASKWLLPRIDGFYADRPSMEVRIQASDELVNFAEENVDLAIRYGSGQYQELRSEKLLDEHVLPVCHPALLSGEKAIESLADLAEHTLIHDSSHSADPAAPSWAMWLKAAGAGDVQAKRSLHFDLETLALDAALAGKGVALARRILAAEDLAGGRLVAPFEGQVAVSFAYYMVAPEPQWRQRKISEYVAWLKDEASGSAHDELPSV